MKTLHASMLSKQPLPLSFLSRLEMRLRGPTSKLITRQQQPADGKTANMSPVAHAAPERKEDSIPGRCLVVSAIAGGGKADGDRLSSSVREGASTGASKGVSAAARTLCEAIVELDRTVEESNSNGKQEQLSALVCLYDCVARGIFLYCEGSNREDGGGICSRSLEALRKLVENATEVNASLFGKRRSLARLSATRRKSERELQTLTEEVIAFAKQHKPELATTEDIYERNRIAFLAKRVKIPAKVPRVRDWFVPRTLLVEEICNRLGIYAGKIDDTISNGGVAAEVTEENDEARMVGLAGPAGCGKSTAASLVIAREDVRGHFHDGIVWLAVGGKGAKRRLPELMLHLANTVHETVLLHNGGGSLRPPSKPGVMADRENGVAYGVAYSVAYIRSVMGIGGVDAQEGGGSSSVDRQRRRRRPRYLIIADDVHEPEVLQELKGIGVTVLYTTTRSASGLRGASAVGGDVDLLRLDDLLEEEADAVLRQAAGIKQGVDLPKPARDFMKSYGSVVMDLAYVGRWGVVHKRTDAKSWDMALNRVFIEGGEGGEEWTRRRWHTAVLFAGMADLGRSNVKAKDLYLYLGVLPRGLAFMAADAGALLFGQNCTPADLQTVTSLLASLERCSVLTLEEGGRYCMHSSHADFVRQRISSFPLSRKRALERWRQHLSTPAALFAWPVEDLVEIWCAVAELSGPGVAVERPYDAVLAGMDQSSTASDKFMAVLERVARFHALAEDLPEAHAKFSKLVEIGESKLGGASPTAAGSKLLLVEHFHSLGAIAAALGKAQEAESAHLRARSLHEETLGADHPDVARSLLALAACASAAGKRADQQRFLHRALTIWGEGPREGSSIARGGWTPLYHFDVAKALQTLGSFALKAGRAREAEGLLRRALASWEASLGDDHPSTARTLHSLGVCAYDGGKLAEAGEFYRRALKIRQAKLGPHHPDVAMTLHNLGGCEWKAGRAEEAEALYRQVLSIRVEALGAEHLLVARTLHSLGGCARHAGRDGEATGLYSSALAVRETKLGPSHPEVAATLHEMGVSAFRGKQIARAEGYFRRALSIKEEVAASKAKNSDAGAASASAIAASLDTAYTLHDLGGVVFASGGRTEEAEELFRRALEIRQKQSGDSLAAASTLQCLGECARERSSEPHSDDGDDEGSGSDGGRSKSRPEEKVNAAAAEEAVGFYTRALAIQEEKLGKDHLYVAYTLFQLGLCLLRCGGVDLREKAMAAFTRSLTVRERELGGTHEDVLHTLHYLGACASACGRVSEAEGWYRRAVSAEELTLGADHPSVARTLHLLGACVLRAGKIDEGIELLRRALQIPEEEGEKGVSKKKAQLRLREGQGHHLDVALTMQQLAVCAADAGRTGDADALFREVLAIEEEKLGAKHRDVADTLSNLGECALKSGRTKEATEFYERALEIEEESFGADQPVLGSTLHCLGLCAEKDGRAEEAQVYFRRSLAIEENQLGEDHPHVAATLADLAAISLASGSTEEAEDLLRRALAITEKTTSAETGTLHCLAECTRKRGRHSEAEGLLMRALAIEQRSNSGDALASSGGSAFASTTPSSGAGPVAATLGELASCACEAGRAEQAEEWFRRALEAEEEKLGKGHRDVAATLTRLGKCLSQQNKVEEAAEAHRRALSIVEETEGDRCLEVTTILLDIGLCALHMGRMEEAEVLYRRAWTIESEHLGPDHPDVLATARALDLFAPPGSVF